MTSLLDLGPLSEEVAFNTRNGVKKVEVLGVTTGDLYYLIKNFPEIRALMQKKINEITPDSLVKVGTKAFGMIVAFATEEGDRDDKQVMERILKVAKLAERYPASVQLNLAVKILSCTFHEGLGPFLEQLGSITQTFKTVKQTIEDQTTTSQGHSGSQLQMDSLDKRRGPLRRVNSPPGMH